MSAPLYCNWRTVKSPRQTTYFLLFMCHYFNAFSNIVPVNALVLLFVSGALDFYKDFLKVAIKVYDDFKEYLSCCYLRDFAVRRCCTHFTLYLRLENKYYLNSRIRKHQEGRRGYNFQLQVPTYLLYTSSSSPRLVYV